MLIYQKSTGNEHRKQRCAGIDNSGKTRANVILAPDNERKWHHVVEQSEHKKSAPEFERFGHFIALDQQNAPKHDRRNTNSQRYDC